MTEQGSLGNSTLIRPCDRAKSFLLSYVANDGGDVESISGMAAVIESPELANVRSLTSLPQ